MGDGRGGQSWISLDLSECVHNRLYTMFQVTTSQGINIGPNTLQKNYDSNNPVVLGLSKIKQTEQ